MRSDLNRQRTLLRGTAAWWDTDRNRLRVIRGLAYLLFAASLTGTIYGGVRNALPVWAITLYVAFAVQFIFMTFMYAIKHSGAQEIRHAVFTLRRERISQWSFERRMLAEFSRYSFCTANGIDPASALPADRKQSRLRPRKAQWPTISTTNEVCKYVRESLTEKLALSGTDESSNVAAADRDAVLALDFIAYSAETLINLSRDICAEIDETLEQAAVRYRGLVRVRILIRDTSDGNQWLVPLATDEESDRSYAADLRTRFRNVQRSALREFHESLKDILAPKQIDFRVRGYRTEPLIKGIMVDGSKGLFGLYTIDDLRDPDGWDYSGHGVTLCPCDTAGGFVPATTARFFNEWFDQLWDNQQLTKSLD